MPHSSTRTRPRPQFASFSYNCCLNHDLSFFSSASFCSAFNGAALTTSAKPSSAIKMSFESEIGAQPPLGFWDPLGLLNDTDQERFDRLRYVEIKHGRNSMLAVLGHIVQQNVRLPGMLSTSSNLAFADMPNGVAALSKTPPLGLAQIVALWDSWSLQ